MPSSECPNVGISGLALPNVQAFPPQYLPIFAALRKAKIVDQGVFQFTLRPGTGSSLFIGGLDNSQYTGDIVWRSFDPSLGFYVVPATINGQQINIVVDSGPTLIMGPTSQVCQFLQSLPGVTVATV
ncbi:aspartic endopeptidase [Malassezia pachydermatis]